MKRKWSIVLIMAMVLVMTSFTTAGVSAATVTVSSSTSITIKGDTVKLTTTNGKAITGYTLTKGGTTVESRSYSAASHANGSSSITVSFASKAAGSYVLKYKAKKLTVTQKMVSSGGSMGFQYVYEYTGAESSYTVYITNEGGGSSGGSSGDSSAHSYTDNCDTTCNKCGAIRTAPHSYSGSCDTICNLCYKTRSTSTSHSYSNSCDENCNVCGTYRSAYHFYSNDCDSYCDYCMTYRTAPHRYSGNCDETCDDCGYERYTYDDHRYSSDCDTTCYYCGYTRTAPHYYYYDCEVACRDCGYQRVPEDDHYFDYECSKECYYCGFTRKAEHIYNNACDEDCNACGDYRSVKHDFSVEKGTPATFKYSGEYWTVCGVCGEDSYDWHYVNSIGKISLSKTVYTYDGGVKSPKVTVKDSFGNTISSKYYTITKSSGRKNVGKYTYTIKFKGRYSGTKKLSFTIKPKATAIKTPKAAKKAITVKWTKGKSSQVSGYEIQIATNSKFSKGKKLVPVKGYKATSKKITKLKSKTKYYVRVRTYKTVKVNGKSTKIYSDWSKVKTVKAK